jgi:antitoxin component of RelBE/YafQ-DinJ toxin-antitoxin module
MGLPKTIRIDDDLEEKVQRYLEKNEVKFTQLVNLALEKFISEPQTIHLEAVGPQEFLKASKAAYKKHKHAMDKLK